MGAIPPWDRAWAHLAAATGIGALVLVLGAFGIRQLRLVELLVIPAVFVIANAFEWRAHRDVLHKRRRLLEEIYDRHTPQHHMIFMTEDMAIRSSREFRLVLIPALGVLGIVAVLTPLAGLVGWLLTPNCGWLVLVTAALHGYLQLSHSRTTCRTTAIGRRKLVRVLEHHARHHDPRLMQRYNST